MRCLGLRISMRRFPRRIWKSSIANMTRQRRAIVLGRGSCRDHLEELPITIEPCERGVITEFDFLTDLVAFDRDFFANVDSRILDNICKTLDCEREDPDVKPVEAGLTNLSTLFSAKGQKYIYRHPGNGTERMINPRGGSVRFGRRARFGLG